ncbi:hypothetical protein BDY17DRAFT_325747 [Neohortaea acidophila]|uniref:Uncharacterized protein n=1 Tax=Neohortaea acidophila TaxID=245834 RepID=A0A6A6PNL1_9PEZI|nr:uncharacterized protein BDY17DRAFT_325747 [Neohortaea acidophila]KAF2481023.1 hypothetical protein BDY17DRAFT_325747 [Neohortaea acidophila]
MAEAAAAASPRPTFNPVETTFNPHDITTPPDKDDVQSPSLSSSNALARFEFEPGKSRDGTKVLMVEWEDDEHTRAIRGDWEVRWEGKKAVLPAREERPEGSQQDDHTGPVNRLYFLLGPGVNIPTTVRLRKGSVAWKTNPLPAIFNPELGATARQAGRKGVLHTIWAKKRLQGLQGEIEREAAENPEGIGLEMARAEKEWIEGNFGVVMKSATAASPASPASSSSHNAGVSAGGSANGSPVSPGGRLTDKLRGLRLQTSANGAGGSGHNPLSPETGDVAVGSFGSFAALKGMPPAASSLAAKPAQPPGQQQQSQRHGGGPQSLDAVANGSTAAPTPPPSAVDAKHDDLFALPMSPKGAGTTAGASPFSFHAQDTRRYVQS